MGAVKMPCCSWRLRPIGPPAPRLGGRRPRRRLCFPPPEEGGSGPAFIFFSCEALKLLPGLDHRPDCFVFPRGRHVRLWRVAQRATYRKPQTAHRLTADQTPPRLDTIRERKSRTMFQTVFNSGRLEFCWARTASLEAWPLGTSSCYSRNRRTRKGG